MELVEEFITAKQATKISTQMSNFIQLKVYEPAE